MHGMGGPACPYPSTGVGPSAQQYRTADAFLHYWVGRIMASPAWNGNSTIFITWDEGSYSNVGPNYGPQSDAGCCDSPILPNPPVNPATVPGGDLVGGTRFGGGRVAMIVIARKGARHYTNATPVQPLLTSCHGRGELRAAAPRRRRRHPAGAPAHRLPRQALRLSFRRWRPAFSAGRHPETPALFRARPGMPRRFGLRGRIRNSGRR